MRSPDGLSTLHDATGGDPSGRPRWPTAITEDGSRPASQSPSGSHRAAGIPAARCLPPQQFIPQLMEHLHEPCYVALLNAAEFLGGAHQRPQVFQVMVRTNRRPLRCGDWRVEFVVRKDLDRMPRS